jgi:uncharacterized membrane protein YbaN (DUF454 family)
MIRNTPQYKIDILPMAQQDPIPEQRSKLMRPFYLAGGWLCVGLASLGIIFPVLPTTPFLLVAVWAFTRASPELADRIRNHPRFGPYVVAWESYGVIPSFAKVLAVVMMAVSFAWLVYATEAPIPVKIAVGLILAAVAAYIITRPSHVVVPQTETARNQPD